jgi:hypothetical protein
MMSFLELKTAISNLSLSRDHLTALESSVHCVWLQVAAPQQLGFGEEFLDDDAAQSWFSDSTPRIRLGTIQRRLPYRDPLRLVSRHLQKGYGSNAGALLEKTMSIQYLRGYSQRIMR